MTNVSLPVAVLYSSECVNLCSCGFGIKFINAQNIDQYSAFNILAACHLFGLTSKIKIGLDHLFFFLFVDKIILFVMDFL